MKSLGFSVLTVALMATSGTAFAAGDSGKIISTTRTVTSAPVPIVQSSLPVVQTNQAPNWGGQRDGRWVGGSDAPGGWNAYRPAFRGFVLPSYWSQPSFVIGNYARYGFAQPQSGFGWSRYYDDAVLTDRSGRVFDTVRGVDWNRSDDSGFGEDYRDSYGYGDDGYRSEVRDDRRRPDRDHHGGVSSVIGSIGGALIGGAVGAVAGNLIAGRGDRLAGSLIGGGLGALAGVVVGSQHDRDRGSQRFGRNDRNRRDHDRGYDDRYRRGGDYYDDYYRGGYRDRGGYETFTTVNYTPVAPIATTTVTTSTSERVVYSGGTRVRVAYRQYYKPRRVCHPVHRAHRAPSQCVIGS